VTVVILASNYTDAMRYAAEQGWRPGDVRASVSAKSLEGVLPTRIIELPSYAGRPDRHAIEAVLRWAVDKVERWGHTVERERVDWAYTPPALPEDIPVDQLPLVTLNEDIWEIHDAPEPKPQPRKRPEPKPNRAHKAPKPSSFFQGVN